MIKLLRSLAAMLVVGLSPIVHVPLAFAAVTYTSAVKAARMTAVRDAWGASAKIKVYHSDGTTLLATFTLSATTADSTISGSVLTCKFTGNSASQSVTAVASGTATSAKVTTSADVDIITGLTVGAGSGDVNLNTTTVGSGATVTITGCSFTHAWNDRGLQSYALFA